jgi:hypothetical protein
MSRYRPATSPEFHAGSPLPINLISSVNIWCGKSCGG